MATKSVCSPEEKQQSTEQRDSIDVDPDVYQEKYRTVQQVAELLNISPDKVRRMFRSEPGVLKIVSQSGLGRRPYETLRIPPAVLRNFLRKHSLGNKNI